MKLESISLEFAVELGVVVFIAVLLALLVSRRA